MKTIAIIPARGGSKRLPRKNILDLCGVPMISYPIQACLKSGVFDSVIVSTEDDEIKAIAEKAGARVIVRPDELATDSAHETLAYKHVIETLASEGQTPEFFCGVYATAALIDPEDLKRSYDVVTQERPDVLMAVSEYSIHPYKALQKNENGFYEMVYPVECKMRSQFYPRYVASNGTFYWFKTDAFLKDPNYYPERLSVYTLDHDKAIDIDTLDDFKRAEMFLKIKRRGHE